MSNGLSFALLAGQGGVKPVMRYMGGCQNDGTFLGILNIRCRIIIGIQKGTIILTTTHIGYVYLGDILT